MKRELKIGILAIAVLVASFFVINFLRGKDILNKEYELVSFYDDVQGLLPSSAVYIKGFKAGTVSDVSYDRTRQGFDVVCSISKDFSVPSDSRMTIYSADLMGGKAIRIDLGTSSVPAGDGDFLQPSVSPDMLSSIAAGIEPIISKGSEVLDDLDSALVNLNLTLSDENRATLRHILVNIDSAVDKIDGIAGTLESGAPDIEAVISNLNSLSAKLAVIADKADASMSDINSISAKLDSADIAGLVASMDSQVMKLHASDGTVGKLVNDDSVYLSVDSLISDISSLVKKIEQNPKKYIRISVF